MKIPKRPEFNGDYFFAFGLAERQKMWDDKYTNMTKEQAIDALEMGAKVSHYHFTDSEFIKMENGQIVDEQGLVLIDFWEVRFKEHWLKGWSVVN